MVQASEMHINRKRYVVAGSASCFGDLNHLSVQGARPLHSIGQQGTAGSSSGQDDLVVVRPVAEKLAAESDEEAVIPKPAKLGGYWLGMLVSSWLSTISCRELPTLFDS